jgi:hypothetical protein
MFDVTIGGVVSPGGASGIGAGSSASGVAGSPASGVPSTVSPHAETKIKNAIEVVCFTSEERVASPDSLTREQTSAFPRDALAAAVGVPGVRVRRCDTRDVPIRGLFCRCDASTAVASRRIDVDGIDPMTNR